MRAWSASATFPFTATTWKITTTPFSTSTIPGTLSKRLRQPSERPSRVALSVCHSYSFPVDRFRSFWIKPLGQLQQSSWARVWIKLMEGRCLWRGRIFGNWLQDMSGQLQCWHRLGQMVLLYVLIFCHIFFFFFVVVLMNCNSYMPVMGISWTNSYRQRPIKEPTR